MMTNWWFCIFDQLQNLNFSGLRSWERLKIILNQQNRVDCHQHLKLDASNCKISQWNMVSQTDRALYAFKQACKETKQIKRIFLAALFCLTSWIYKKRICLFVWLDQLQCFDQNKGDSNFQALTCFLNVFTEKCNKRKFVSSNKNNYLLASTCHSPLWHIMAIASWNKKAPYFCLIYT